MEKCIMIGGTGFIGKNLLNYLSAADKTCDNLTRQDLYDVSTINFNGYDTVIHAAGIAHDVKGNANKDLYYKVNFELTKKLYDRFLLSDAKQFIFLSSVKAAADDIEGILTEGVLPQPKTIYGRTKLMAEQYLLRQSLPHGKAVYMLRPCMTHGEGNKGNLNLLYNIVQKGVPYPLAAFNNKRSFLSVQNLCFIINEIIERDDVPSGIYNVADDEALSTSEVIAILANSLNKKPNLWNISPKLVNYSARLGDKLNLPLTTERLNKLTENYVVSNTKITAAIKKTLPLSAKEGLELTARFFSQPNTNPQNNLHG